MPIGINSGVGFSPAPADRTTQQSFERISSGNRINQASDDAAGLAISQGLTREVDGLSVAIRNAGDGVSLTQVASGGLDSLREDFSRLRELSLQSANGTLNDQDRQALQEEANQILEGIQQTLDGTSFNGRDLFKDDNDLSFQTGSQAGETVTLQGQDLNETLGGLGGLSIDISSQDGATRSLGSIDDSMEAINQRDAEFGAIANRLDSRISQASQQREANAEARSRIQDADIAEESSRLASSQIREQADIAIRAQANSRAEYVLRLLS